MGPRPFPDELRRFVADTPWTFAKTYAATWPHEYVVRTAENAALILALAKHILDHGQPGRFYHQVRPYHHEDGKAYWVMDDSAEEAELVNRCAEDQMYEARRRAGTLP